MKKFFFFLVVANLLLFLGGRLFAPPPPEAPDMRSGGNIRFLSPGELEAYRASGGGAGEVEGDAVTPAAVVEDPEVFRARLVETLKLKEGECLALGPIETRDDAATLAEELAAQNMAGIVRSETRSEVRNYLVVVPTRTSVEAAAMVKRLREAGQKDVWWLTSGDHKDEVSVGIFRSRENAATRKKEVEALEFDAEIVPREVDRVSYWLDLRAEPSRRVTVELVEKLRARHDTLSAERKRCTRSAL